MGRHADLKKCYVSNNLKDICDMDRILNLSACSQIHCQSCRERRTLEKCLYSAFIWGFIVVFYTNIGPVYKN